MKTNASSRKKQSRRGFSLTEAAMGMMLLLGVAGTTVAMTGQHVQLMNTLNSYSFLRDEAPSINILLSRLLQRADSYRIYPDKASAFSGSGAVTTGGTAVGLRFRNPDGTFAEAVVVYEPSGARIGLNLYNRTALGWGGSPDWTISSRPSAVQFSNSSGVLLIRVTGPDQDQITYVGSSE
ncbi:MAG: hypothetical protein JNK37_08910 [Verrucomicrobiales bacterium]|nr:hypothetical protein [Verrucomicrobiales bacterium]